MPMPRAMRSVSRFLNPAVMPLARRMPPLAIVRHVGRTSGRAFANPVMAFPTDGGWVVALAYGSDVQWAANLRSARGGELDRRGRAHRVGGVRELDASDGARRLPGWARTVMKMAKVDAYLLLEAPAAGA